jgi:hypothetical protein
MNSVEKVTLLDIKAQRNIFFRVIIDAPLAIAVAMLSMQIKEWSIGLIFFGSITIPRFNCFACQSYSGNTC